MDGLFAFARGWSALIKLRYDDDSIDRLNHLYSGLLSLFFAVIVTGKQYGGHPLLCWLPPYLKGFDGYVNNYCWISNTWWMPLHHQVPDDHQVRTDREIGYYQWVPFFLLFQAFFFHIPCILWRAGNSLTGIDVHAIIQKSIDTDSMDSEERKNNISYLGAHIDSTLDRMQETRTGFRATIKKVETILCPVFGSHRQGFSLFLLYFFSKILYMANLLGQIALLNLFLELDYKDTGYHLSKTLMEGSSWEFTGRFPRVTMCDFIIKVLGNQHRHTVQCLLPINLMNEKIFVVMFFWLRIVAVLTAMNIIMWTFRMLFFRYSYIRKRLLLTNSLQPSDERAFGSFCDHHLRTDGIFMMRLIKDNSGDLLSIQLIRTMWFSFKHRMTGQSQIEDGTLTV